MNRRHHNVMAALAAARPTAFEPTERPDPEVRNRDLRRVLARPQSRQHEPLRVRQAATSRRRLATAAVAAVLVVAAATAVAVPALRRVDHGPGPITAGAEGRRSVDARRFLLATAARVQRLPASTGAYWYQEERTSEVQTLGTGGKSGRGPAYTVEVSQVTKSWSGRSRTRAVTTFDRPRFLTSQDRVNWRTAGSPHLMPGAPPAGNPTPTRR